MQVRFLRPILRVIIHISSAIAAASFIDTIHVLPQLHPFDLGGSVGWLSWDVCLGTVEEDEEEEVAELWLAMKLSADNNIARCYCRNERIKMMWMTVIY